MSNSSNSSKGKGNSRLSQRSASSLFCFTLNNYSLQQIEQFQNSPLLYQYVFQRETGESGTPHLQGWCKYKTKTRLTAINKDFPGMHWEICRNRKQSIAYCSDPEKRDLGTDVYSMNMHMKFREGLRTLTTLRPWQHEIIDLIEEQGGNGRTVNWFWEGEGNYGKTCFARYLAIKKDALYICGSAADMKCGLAEYMEENNGCFPKIVILDIPRDSAGCSYKGLEQCLGGIFYSTKFHSQQCIFNPPFLLVFANSPPERNRMSEDRWRVRELGVDLVNS